MLTLSSFCCFLSFEQIAVPFFAFPRSLRRTASSSGKNAGSRGRRKQATTGSSISRVPKNNINKNLILKVNSGDGSCCNSSDNKKNNHQRNQDKVMNQMSLSSSEGKKQVLLLHSPPSADLCHHHHHQDATAGCTVLTIDLIQQQQQKQQQGSGCKVMETESASAALLPKCQKADPFVHCNDVDGSVITSNDSLNNTPSADDREYGRSLAEIPKCMWNLISNPVYIVTCLGSCMELSIVSGFLVFLPKYLETQFTISKSEANLFAGGIAVPGACIGIFLGGFLLKKFGLGIKGTTLF